MRKIIDDQRLIYRCCSLYYENNMGQKQIAERLGISKSSVSRMLMTGRELGIVEIKVHHLSQYMYEDLEEQLKKKFHLRDVVVAESNPLDSKADRVTKLNERAAPYLRIAVTSPDKTLVFRHVIAKVVVHLKAGNGVTGDELQRATVTFENLTCTGGSINFSNGTVAQVTPRIDRITPNEVTPAADGYVRTVRALLPPQDMSKRKFVKIVIGGKTFYYTPAADEADFFSGKMYEYRLTVTSEGIENIDVEEGGGTWQPVE